MPSRWTKLARPWLSLFGLLALACLTQPKTPIEGHEIEALIERAKGLRSFHATYDLDQGQPADAFEDYELELAYQAPDRGFVRFSGSSDLFEAWCTGERLVVHTRGGAAGEQWRTLRAPDPGSGVRVCLAWPGLDDGERFAAWLDFRPAGAVPLDWLRSLQRTPASASRDGGRIYWSGRRFRCWLSASTGLPEWLGFTTPDGFEFTLDLDELTLDEPLAPGLLEPPPEAAGAEPFAD